MGDTTTMKASDWLAELGSHTLYHAEILAGIPGVAVTIEADHATLAANGRSVRTWLQTPAQVVANPGKAGVTLTLGPDDEDVRMVAGYALSADLATLLAGRTSSALGRGFAFRENLALIRDAGY